MLLTNISLAQDLGEAKPLEDILVILQQQHGVRFNYDPENIQEIYCSLPDSSSNLEQTIELLEQETGLRFNMLSNNFISIRPDVKMICGYLIDASTQEPVAFATVEAGDRSTIADENGYFEIHNLAADSIAIHHVSYIGKQLRMGNTSEDCPVFSMEPNQQILPEIVLNDYLITGINKLNNGSYKIDFNEFTILPGLTDSDVLQSVQAFPGILSVNETVSNINIRGGSHDQNLILWDGIKMYQSGHFFGLISMYHPQITRNVILRKNGTPAKTTDGVSGTIQMKTDPEINRQLSGNVAINFTDVNGFVDIPTGKTSSVQVAARKSISDLIKTPTYKEYFNRISQDTEIDSDSGTQVNSNVKFDFLDGSVRWLYSPSTRDQIRLNFIYTKNNLTFNENALIDSQQISKESSLDQSSIGAGVYYQRIWSKRHRTTINVYESDYKLKAINVNLQQNQRFLQENKVSETGAGLISDYDLSTHLRWQNGYQFVETKVTNLDDVDNPVYRKLTGAVIRAHAAFSELSWVSKDGRTNLTIGGRLNYLEKFKRFIPEPRITLNHWLSDSWNIELLAEDKHQYTSQIINFQNDFLGIEKRRWQLSDNDTIPIITGRQISLGVSYNKSGWLINGVAYYKSVDGISSQSQGFQNQFEFVKSAGSYISSGVDLLIRKQFRSLNSWLSYSFLDSQYTFTEFEDNSFPSNFDITNMVSVGISYNKAPLLLSAGLNWHTGKPTTRPQTTNLEDQIVYQSPNSDRLANYWRMDLSAIYQLYRGSAHWAEFGFSIWNLLDRENPIGNYYSLDQQNEPREVVQHSLGLTPNILARFYF
jgi:hypothetical protein